MSNPQIQLPLPILHLKYLQLDIAVGLQHHADVAHLKQPFLCYDLGSNLIKPSKSSLKLQLYVFPFFLFVPSFLFLCSLMMLECDFLFFLSVIVPVILMIVLHQRNIQSRLSVARIMAEVVEEEEEHVVVIPEAD